MYEIKKTKKVDGLLFEKMIRSGLSALAGCEKEINALNVFPVADGDTGTNMRLTLENGIRCAPPTRALNEYLKALSSGMLLGARGNSGVILSQIFKGIYLELSRASVATPVEMRNAFIRGYKVAYESVIKPVEGTILTVAREGIEQATRQMKSPADVESLLTAYLSSMEISLAATPDVLPILAEMGVVDSGGKGYIQIVRGMLQCLQGDKGRAPALPPAPSPAALASAPTPDLSLFDENSDFEQGYCMEFILQLMQKPQYRRVFRLEDFIRTLEKCGDSLVTVQDGSRVKVHIHTKKPAPVMEFAQQFGEFLTFKLENMQLQHNEYLQARSAPPPVPPAPPRPHKPLSVIAVVNGEGNRQTFADLGCDCVIDGGATMNASSQEFLQAMESVDADIVAILPDGPNMMLSAQQAVDLSQKKNVHVLPARTLAEGYYALAMDVPDSPDQDMRLKQMRMGIDSIETLMVTTAARSYAHNGVACQENEWIAVWRDELIFTAQHPVDAVIEGLQKIEDFEDKESCVFFRGAHGDAGLEKEIEKRIQQLNPLMECQFLSGGQEIYDWIIGIM